MAKKTTITPKSVDDPLKCPQCDGIKFIDGKNCTACGGSGTITASELVDKLGRSMAAIAPYLGLIEAMKARLKEHAISCIALAEGDDAAAIKAKLEAAEAGAYAGSQLFDASVFVQSNNSTNYEAVWAKLESLLTTPGQFTRFRNSVITAGTKWVVKVTAKKLPQNVASTDLDGVHQRAA